MSELRRRLEFYRDLGITEIYRRAPQVPAAEAARGNGDVPEAPPAVEAAPLLISEPEPMPTKPAARPAELNFELPPLAPPNDTLEQIRADIGECTRCVLHRGRTNLVFGSGNPRAKLVFVGEGPGADEDAQGLPFVGRAGQLLTQMIDNTAAKEGMAIRREDVYICNVVKCRPPENRTPLPEEMATCGQFLFRQLLVLRPKVIVCLGSTAGKALLNLKEGITKARGQWYQWREFPVMLTYHPSYLLRNQSKELRREAWEDLKAALHRAYD